MIALSAPLRSSDGGIDVTITLSVGATLTQRGQQIDGLLHLADTAFYAAKAPGRGQMIVWQDVGKPGTPDMLLSGTVMPAGRLAG